MVVAKKFSSPFLSFSALYFATKRITALLSPKSNKEMVPTSAPIAK